MPASALSPAAVAWAAARTTRSSVLEVVTTPEVASAVAALVVAVLGLGVVTARWARTWLELRIAALSRQISGAEASASEAASQASRAREGVTNGHGSHLRDDLDEVRASVRTILSRMDAAELARQADEDARERRDRRAEDQIDGPRDDMRALSASAERTHTRIEERIRNLEDSMR